MTLHGGPEKLLLETIDSFMLSLVISVNHPVLPCFQHFHTDFSLRP